LNQDSATNANTWHRPVSALHIKDNPLGKRLHEFAKVTVLLLKIRLENVIPPIHHQRYHNV
jgi:hypothetical protein